MVQNSFGNSTINNVSNSTTVVISNSTVKSTLGLASLFLGNSTVNTTVTSSAFNLANTAANGSYTLPGGLLINFGHVTPNSVGSNTITFATAYTTNAYSVQVTPLSNVLEQCYGVSNGVVKTGFIILTAVSTA